MPDRAPALKETLFSPQSIAALTNAIQPVYPAFDVAAFNARVFDDHWPGRALKQRMRHITTVLHSLLPAGYTASLSILRQAAPRLPQGSFVSMVLSDYVEAYGLDDYDASMAALELFTQRVSAEFAVRPFIIRYPERAMAQMLKWADHPDVQVRRLATEGCRPRLPWGVALPALRQDPSPILPILDKLRNDPAETVRRSVANNLNDISKDNPEVVIEVLQRWRQDGATPELGWIIRQALRTLIKAGHPGALELVGVSAGPQVVVRGLSVDSLTIPMGGTVSFTFEIESLSDQPQELVIDYVVHLVRAGGKSTPKVFKLARRSLQPGEIIRISRKHSFQPVSSRRYYEGRHAIQPKINGELFDSVEFMLGE
jgi:3-methyladenine DNA glycosylase AlkC